MKRVAMLAPMTHELDPIVRLLDLEADGAVHKGRAGDVEVLATLTNIGMAAGAVAAERMLDLDVDRVMVVGIAGGVDRSLSIGDLVVPEVVVDRATGDTFQPAPVDDVAPRGVISCGDDLIVDPTMLDAMAADGVVAVEMESAAVAAVCERAGVAWSVFRGISDFAADGLVDAEIFAMTNPDGSADQERMRRYLAEHPEKVAVLTQLAHDMNLATEAAATAAIRACTTV